MAKIYGALVGALINNTTLSLVDNALKDGSHHIIREDYAALATTNVIGDQVSLGVYKSSTYIDPSAVIWNDALGAGVTVNIGDATYPSGLAAGMALNAAGNRSMITTFTPAKMGQRLWQLLGYAADPGGTIELLATVAGANVGAAGSIAWKFSGIER